MRNKFIALTSSLLIVIISCTAPVSESGMGAVENAIPDTTESLEENDFDIELAKRLGADDYGMSQYVIAFLKKGPNRDRTPEEAMELQTAHMENIRRLADEGKLVVAGPFMDSGDLMGIYVFNVTTLEEARALTASDPAIQKGSLVMELHAWYGSAAMKEIQSIHKKIKAKSFN